MKQEKRAILACLLALALIMLGGCGGGKAAREVADAQGLTNTNHIELHKDLSLTQTMTDTAIEEYDDGYEDYIRGLIDSYNSSKGSEGVLLKSVKKSKDSITLVIDYESHQDFEAFNGYPFFCGTVSEAAATGYSTDIAYASADAAQEAEKKDSEPELNVKASDIGDYQNKPVIIVSALHGEALVVETPGKIAYVNNASWISKTEAHPREGEQAVIIWQ